MRLALVGCGIWGSRILRELLALDASVVVVDPSPSVRRAAAALNAEVAETIDAAATVDGWIVATPASTHVEVLDEIAAVADPGARVFCEKPFTTDLAAAERLARAFGTRLSVMHVWRYHPGIELLGEIARSGGIGDVHGIHSTRANWTSPRRDTDTTWTMVPHDLTIAREVLGAIPPPRAAVADTREGRALGLWALLGGGDAPFLAIEAANRVADKRREVRVHGSTGVAVLADLDVDFVELWRGDDLEPDIERVAFTPAQPLRRELEVFMASVLGGDPPKTDAAEGVEVVRVITQLRALAGLGAAP
jgi:predicted dehydrogenase